MRFSNFSQVVCSKTVFAIFLIVGLLCAMPAHAATITVTNGNDSGAGSLRQAISDAQAGDTVVFQAGLGTVTLTTDQLTVDKDLTIDGGSGVTIQRGSTEGTPDFRIFGVAGIIKISNVTISKGKAPAPANDAWGMSSGSGGGIYLHGALTLENVDVTDNAASDGDPSEGDGGKGGGIYIELNSTLTIKNSIISDNTAGNAWRISGNGGSGGGIYGKCGASVILENTSVKNNYAGENAYSDSSSYGGNGGGISVGSEFCHVSP